MGEAVVDAFFSEQAGNEGEIGFAVLQAVGADGVGFAKLGLVLEAFVEGGVGRAVFVEDGFDLICGTVLSWKTRLLRR